MMNLLQLRGTRRSLLGAAAVALPIFLAHMARRQEAPVTEGDCEEEPAVAMLFAWRNGESVYPSVADGMPQTDWQRFQHPSLPVPYLIPPGWTGMGIWTDTFTRAGEPIWQDTPLTLPQLTGTRLVSPDGDALFEYAVGSIQQVILTNRDSISIAQQSVLGEDPNLRSVCVIDDQFNALAPGWFTVDRHESDLLITFGNTQALPHDIAPATVVSFTSMYGPRQDMEDLMYDVYLRILFQFLGGGSDDTDGDDGGDGPDDTGDDVGDGDNSDGDDTDDSATD
jgi:hypothetical protein